MILPSIDRDTINISNCLNWDQIIIKIIKIFINLFTCILSFTKKLNKFQISE